MAGLTESRTGTADSFWSWRSRMFSFLEVLNPDDVEAIASQLYIEMLKAGYTSVGEFHYLHHNPDGDAYENPAEMSHKILSAAEISGIGLTHLSTDYVFDGRDGPYGENDSTHPISHYGALKLASEKPVLEGGLDGLVVRTLWLYGHASGVRPNLVTWPLQALAKGEELRIVDDQWGNPAAVDDLAEALLELCQRRQTGLVHFGGGDFMTRYELVVALAREFALPVDRIHPISTAAMGQPAPRPLRSGLRAELLEAILGRGPITFACGLERLRAQEDFHRDFPAHVR